MQKQTGRTLLNEYRFGKLTLMELMAVLAILGIVVSALLRWFL